MPEFFASTAKGLSEVLEKELKEMGIPKTIRVSGGVFFEGNWETCYKVNLSSRVASRVLKPVQDFVAYQPEELYANIQKHDFTKYIDVHQTIKVEVVVKESKMHDQRFIAMKVKDAIVDQFRDKFGERPNVDNENPDLRIYVRCKKNKFEIAIDTTGESLFMRGYRREAGVAPLKENLAAGLLYLSEWDRQSPIIDPMCGSGTILVEAAMLAMNISPGTLRRHFGFMNLKGFNTEAWEKVLEEVVSAEKEDLDFKMHGSDLDRQMIRMAKENAKRAGVDHVIEFQSESIATYAPPCEKGLLVTNPPYGARIGDEDNLKDVYRDLGYTLKHRFTSWDAWILSGNKDLILDMKLKSTRRHFVFNGPLECRFLKYSMF